MLGASILTGLVAVLPDEALKRVADLVLDVGENFIGSTKTEIDDAILLPMLTGVRNVFGIADNDAPKPEPA